MDNPAAIYFLLAAGIVVLSLVRAWFERNQRGLGFFKLLGRAEVLSLALLVLCLIFFGCLQIFLRNVFHRGLFWAEPLMRHLVLWIGCLGGAYATTRMRHINIDVFSRLLHGRVQALRNFIIYFATAAAAYVLGLAALRLVIVEREYSEVAFLGIDTWMLQAVLPYAFFVISYRCLLNLFARKKMSSLNPADNP
ncbi:MAG: TRAP transporter small permease [Candidatus Latescibacterota bacterium]